MSFIIFGLLLIVTFFILYQLARNDFVLLRKNISLVQVYDYAFIALLFGFVISRLFFIFDTRLFLYLNPFAFLHIVRLPGLSILGFYFGLVLALMIIFRNKSSLQRVYDIFFISMFPLFIGSVIFMDVPRTAFYLPVSLIVLALIFLGLSISFLRNYTLKDGSISLLVFMVISLYSAAYPFFLDRPQLVAGLTLVQIISGLAFLVALTIFMYYQIILPKRVR